MTSVCPIAMKPRMLVAVRIARRLPVLKKLRPSIAVRTAPTTTASDQHDVDDPGRGQSGRRHRALIRRAPRSPTPVASWRTCSSVEPAGSSPARRPSRITRIRSDMPITSGSSLDTMSTATPCGGQRAHQLVDRVLRADVDAAGRLVHEHDAAARWPASGRARPSAGCRRRGTAPPGPCARAETAREDRRPGTSRRGRPVRRGRPRGPPRERCRGWSG